MQRDASTHLGSPQTGQVQGSESSFTQGKLALISTLLTDSDSEIRIQGAKRLGEIRSGDALDIGIECLKRETSGAAFLAICSALSSIAEKCPDRAVGLATLSISLLKGVLSKFQPIEFELANIMHGDTSTSSTPKVLSDTNRQEVIRLESTISELEELLHATDTIVHRFYQNISLESDSDVVVLQGVCSLLGTIGALITDPLKELELVKGIEEAFFFCSSHGERNIRTPLAATYLTSALKGFYSDYADDLRITQLKEIQLGPYAEAVLAGITPQHLHSPSVARMLREFANSHEVAMQNPLHKHETRHLQYLLDSVAPISCVQIPHEEAVDLIRRNTPGEVPGILEDLLIPGTITLKVGWNHPACPLEGLHFYGRTVRGREGEWLFGNNNPSVICQDESPAIGAAIRVYADEANSSYAEDLIILVPDGADAKSIIGCQPPPSSVAHLDIDQTRELFESEEVSRIEPYLRGKVKCMDFYWQRGEATLSGYSLHGKTLNQEANGLLRYSDDQQPIGWAIKYLDSERRQDPKRVIALIPSEEVSPQYWERSPGLDMLESLRRK
jgi:hypothetical protein